MLSDPKAVEIIRRARQKNVAAAERAAHDFDHIFSDFFPARRFDGQRILDLGPGQYDFARRIRDLGGDAHNVENDEAVIQLGEYLGLTVFPENLKQFVAGSRRRGYDGLFCKFSINAFWYDDPAEVTSAVRELVSVLRPDGWGWVAPWNGPGKRGHDEKTRRALLAAQVAAFITEGWEAWELTDDLAAWYGVSGAVENHPIFLRNLVPPARLSASASPIRA